MILCRLVGFIFFVGLFQKSLCSQLLTYGMYRTNIDSGLAIALNDSTSQTYPSVPLNGLLDQTSAIARVGNKIYISGAMQYWTDSPVGNFVVFDLSSGSWGTLPLANTFQGKMIYSIYPIVGFGDNTILVLGYFNNTVVQPDVKLNGMAICNTLTCQCDPFGNTVDDFSDRIVLEGLVQLNSSIYVAYRRNHPMDTSYKVLQVSLNSSKEIATFPSMLATGNLLGTFGGNVVSGWAEMGTYVSCTGYPVVTSLAFFNGACWSNMSSPADYKHNRLISLSASDGAGLLCAVLSSDEKSAKLVECTIDLKNWVEIPIPFTVLGQNVTLEIYVMTSGSFLMQYEVPGVNGGYATLAAIANIDDESFNVLTGTLCNNPDFSSCTVQDSEIYCECPYNNRIHLTAYSFDGQVIIDNSINNLYNTFPSVDSICTAGPVILVTGDVGDAYTVWDGFSWNYPTFQQYPYSTPSKISCTSNGTRIWLVYPGGNLTNMLEISTIDINADIEYINNIWVASSAVQSMWVTQNYVWIIADSNLGRYDPRARTWNANFIHSIVGQQVWLDLIYGIRAVAETNHIMYFAGDFNVTIDGKVYSSIAKYDIISGTWLSIEPVTGTITSLVMVKDLLYAAGSFSLAGDLTGTNVAACNSDGKWVISVGNTTNFGGREISQMQYDESTNRLAFQDYKGYVASYDLVTGNWTSYQQVYSSEKVLFVDYAVKKHTKGGLDVKLLLLIVLPIASVLLVTVGIVVGRIMYYRHKRRGYIQIVSKDIEVALRDLTDDSTIPKIKSGEVSLPFKGAVGTQKALHKGRPVAVKSVFVVEDDSAFKKFVADVRIMSQARHKHIVEFMGVMISHGSEIFLVREWMDTDLASVQDSLSFLEKLKVAKSVAKAMTYLHSIKLLHKNLKPSNVLLSKNGLCKLCDFGIASKPTFTGPSLKSSINDDSSALSHLAPEVLSTRLYSEKADVFSFGVMFCVLLKGQHPYAHLQALPTNITESFLGGKVNPQLPSSIPRELVLLTEECIRWGHGMRPSFNEIQLRLNIIYSEQKNAHK